MTSLISFWKMKSTKNTSFLETLSFNVVMGSHKRKIKLELEERCGAWNERISLTVDQIRSKFKKLVSECKMVALTIKTATGIKRFLDDKGYGAWLHKLFAIVKTRDSCQPEQAIEPSALELVPAVQTWPENTVILFQK